MKRTGIVRRIDDLGRVVIPKELRRTMCIQEGDQMEINVEGNYICLSKYDPTPTIESAVERLKTAVDGLPATSDFCKKLVSQIADFESLIESERGVK